jgi:uncharacterized MAPEG superfamily protein
MSAAVQVLLYITLLTALLAVVAPLYRSTLVLTGRKPADAFPRGGHDGPDWYKRCMDAHANSLENLPLYMGLLVVAYTAGAVPILDQVAYFYLAARLAQSVVHLVGVNHYLVLARFAFWNVQIAIVFYVAVQLLMTVA